MLCWPQGQPVGEIEHACNGVQIAAERLTL